MNVIYRKRRLPTKENIKHAWKNKSGSEAIEMVYSTAALCAIIISALLILMYALQANAVSYAGKRVARYIEVAGGADQNDLNTLLGELLPNEDDINASVRVVALDGWVPGSRTKIQLRDRFQVIVTATYNVTVIDPGFYDPIQIPFSIRVVVDGQSEVYWKT